MQGNSFEEKTSNIIDWFIHGEVREKPIKILPLNQNEREEK